MEEEDRTGQKQQRQEHQDHTLDEEALEIQSLRRIISAYLNYPDAAEQDVRRYERSFRKLPPEHKAILSHLPLKYQRLRRCISVNTYFIMNMLQAFVPPFDMSSDIDIADDDNIINGTKGHPAVEIASNHDRRNFTSEEHACVSGCKSISQVEQTKLSGTSNTSQRSSERKNNDKELRMEISQESVKGDQPRTFENHRTVDSTVADGVLVTNGQGQSSRDSVANGNTCCSSCHWLDPSMQLNVPLVDVDKVRCIIRNIVRDWAPEGQKERDQCYKPILEELNRLFPVRCKDRPPMCLVPGAGLGRLVLEISCLGFSSQGNEFSYYMMICSSFILNHTQFAGEWKIYPWIHSNCNSISDCDQLRAISFPDIHPASAGITEGFSMCAGDFVEVYNDASQEASWDALVTCFFLDTAHNIVEYIEIISRILKDGGVWINLGPLLYHFADTYGVENEMSIELSLEDVKKVALQCGFEIEMEKNIETTYTANPRSMMQNRYSTVFWTMRKKPRA